MKKLIALLMAVLMLCTMFAGCAADTTPSDTTNDTPAADATDTPATDSTDAPADDEPADSTDTPADEPADTADDFVFDSSVYANELQQKLATAAGYDPSKPYNGLTVPVTDEPITFEIYGPFTTCNNTFNVEDNNNMPVVQLAEETTGVHIDWQLTNDFKTQFPLMIASGDWPDAVRGYGFDLDRPIDVYVADEVVMDITDIVTEHCPNYQFHRTCDVDTATRTVTDGGRIVQFYNIKQSMQPTWLGLCSFEKWVEEFGGFEAMDTVAEFTDYLRFLRDDKGCEYPFAMGGTNGQSTQMLPAFDCSDTRWRCVDGVVEFCPVTDDFKEYVETMKSWYDEGLLHSNFYGMTDNPAFDPEGQYNSRYGVWWNSYICLGTTEEQIKADYGVDLIQTGIPTPTREEGGHRRLWMTQDNTLIYNEISYLFDGCEDPVTLCKWFDFFFTREGSLMCDYGVEGLSYNFNENGEPIYIDSILHPEGMGSLTAIQEYTIECIPHHYNWRREVDGILYGSGAAFCDIIDSNFVDEISYPGGASRTPEESETYGPLFTDICTMIDENIVKFIIGDRSMDEWESFIDTLWSMGLQECIDIQQAAYERFVSRDITGGI